MVLVEECLLLRDSLKIIHVPQVKDAGILDEMKEIF